MKSLIALIFLIIFSVFAEEEMIGNLKINSFVNPEKVNDSQYSLRKSKKWQASLSFAHNALSISYNLIPSVTVGFRVNELNRVIGEDYLEGKDYRPLLSPDNRAVTFYKERETKTSFGKVNLRENIFLHYYPENPLLDDFPVYFGINLGKTYGTFREETDFLTYMNEPIRDPDATVDREIIQNGYPMTYRRVTEKPNFYFGWALGFRWVTSSGLFFGTEMGTGYRGKPEIDAIVMVVPWNKANINLNDIGIMTNALKVEYASRTTFQMHYVFTVGYAF